VLAAIVKNFDFALCPGHKVWPILRVTLRPANGLAMLIKKREPFMRTGARGLH